MSNFKLEIDCGNAAFHDDNGNRVGSWSITE